MFAGSRLLLPVLTNFITLVPTPERKEGHAVREPSLLRGIAVLRRSGSRKKRRPPVAARSGGAGAKKNSGTEDSLPCSWVEEGWLPSERERRSRPVRLEAEACCHPPCLGRSRERGTRCRLPRPEEPSPSARRRMSIGPSTKRSVPSHGTASEPLSWLRTKRQCVREPDRDFYFYFFSLPYLVSVTPHPSVSFLSLVCPYPQVRRGRPDGLPPGRGE